MAVISNSLGAFLRDCISTWDLIQGANKLNSEIIYL